MRLFLGLVALCVTATVVVGYPQSQSVDPAYLRQYYAHLAQANREGSQEAAPIYESGHQEQSQAYAAPQIRQYQAAAPQTQQYVQPQTQQYKSSPKQAPRRPAYGGLKEEQEEEYDDQASYQFGFDVKDDEFTNYQNRQESRDGGIIKGSYSVVDSDGFIRTVKYTADPKEGFKAEVVREPTDIVVKIPPPHQSQQQETRHQNHQYREPAYKQAQPQRVQQQQQQPQYQYE